VGLEGLVTYRYRMTGVGSGHMVKVSHPVLKAHRLLYHSTLDLRVIKKKKKPTPQTSFLET